MPKSQPKRHHYVPQVLLKRFVDADDWLYLFSKVARTDRVRRTRIENAFVEGHLYSEIDADGCRNPAVEHELAKLDSAVDPVLEKLAQAARSGLLPGLTAKERLIWDTFFVVQWRRVPDLHLTVTTDDEVREYLCLVSEDMKRRFPHQSVEIDAMAEPDTERVIIKNARVKSVLGVSDRVLQALQSRGIALLRIRAPGKALIIASRPVIQMAFQNGLSIVDEPTEMWLPIASDLAIGAGRKNVPEVIYDLHDHKPIRYLNLAMARQSTAFASHSEALTRSIANAK